MIYIKKIEGNIVTLVINGVDIDYPRDIFPSNIKEGCYIVFGKNNKNNV